MRISGPQVFLIGENDGPNKVALPPGVDVYRPFVTPKKVGLTFTENLAEETKRALLMAMAPMSREFALDPKFVGKAWMLFTGSSQSVVTAVLPTTAAKTVPVIPTTMAIMGLLSKRLIC